jgi:UPF0271 protein
VDTVTINADIGEGIGLHEFGNDEELMALIDIGNVACGFHASDPQIMDRTVSLAAEHGVKLGAHPGLPDLAGFGRRAMSMTADEVENIVRYQTGALSGFLRKHGLDLNHIKPHGALFGMVGRDRDLMAAVCRVARDYAVPVVGIGGTYHRPVAEDMGVEFIAEIYVDLNYDSEGKLIIERKPKPAIPEKARARIERALSDGKLETVDGGEVDVTFDSVCVHSDPPNAPDVVNAVRSAFNAKLKPENR